MWCYALAICLMVSSQIGYGVESKIDMWVRSRGNYTDGADVQKTKLITVGISDKKANEAEIFDAQIGKKRFYRGVYLKNIIDDFKDKNSTDLALLHFRNGMIVPLRLAEIDDNNPFVAIAVKNDETKKWTHDFPKIARPVRENVRDPRPITMQGNKLVLKSLAHPMTHGGGKSGFSPWLFVDSLQGIELVNETAYYNQFKIGSGEQFEHGQTVFVERCQYCHGVRRIGASFGWDYVDPLPIYKQKTPTNLFFHVKMSKIDEYERGLLMPRQQDLTEKEAKDLWEWMKIQAEKKQKPYSS